MSVLWGGAPDGRRLAKLRSPLFAPGDSQRKAAKALAGNADAVILDLEDSVAPAGKDAARAMVQALLPTIDRPGVIVRINPPDTAWYLADLAAIVAGRPAAIMLPKCGGPDDLAALDHHLEALETASGQVVGSIAVLPIVTETAAGALALARYAHPPGKAMARVRGLCFGAEDLSADLGISPRLPGGHYPAPVAAARAAVVLAAAACGVAAIDTPWPDPRDPDGLAREAQAAHADGFSGKLCIHPDQIAAVNAAFTPDAARLGWARRVVDGFAQAPAAGVFTLDGKMIDQPHLKLARRILAAADEADRI
jgi:citrate lyase subunit beta/citryl-CoA lyase